MSEELLQSLMQLFAIIAKLDGSKAEERNVVALFLNNQLNLEDSEKYLSFFDQYLEDHSRVRKPPKNATTHTRLTVRDSSKMLLICTRINQELSQRQKVVVLFTLLALIRADDHISAIEYEFLTTVADIFNISIKEFKLIETFAWSKQLHEADMEDLLFISNKHRHYNISRHIIAPHIEGEISVMRIAAIGMYMIRFDGTGIYYLNGLQMFSGELYALESGSVIKGSRLNAIYYSDIVSKFLDTEGHEHLNFTALHISYTFANGRVGLHDLSIGEESGKLVGLMGASGAGKSTLLEILNGNLAPTKGQVLLNGIDIHQQPDKVKGLIGYVPQDDLLIEELSVYQNLYYAACLCFGIYSKTQIHELVDKTLISLGLSDISHLKVGTTLDKTISGGERKRLNIGLELLRAPSVLFVDEPTSGLSSRDSLNIMDLLKELTLSGKLVFVVIHQPSSDIFKLFDKLIIIDTGGYPIYYGNPIEAIVYFKSLVNQINKQQTVCSECGNVNPEQIFDIVETRIVNQYGRFTSKRKFLPETWNQHFVEKQKEQEFKVAQSSITGNLHVANWLRQWQLFLQRDFLSKINNKQYLIVNFMQAPLLALVLAFVNRYYKNMGNSQGYFFGLNENIPVFFFIAIIVALFMGLVVSAEEIFHDRRMLKREAFLDLSRSSYLLSKVAILFAMSAIQTLMFVLVSNLILDIRDFTLIQWLILFSVSCFANLLGLNISSAFSSAVTIYIMIPILLIPQLVLGGIVVKFDKINPAMASGDKVPFLGDMMASRWAFEAVMVSQFRYNPYMQPLFDYDRQINQAEFKKVYLYPALTNQAQEAKDAIGQANKGNDLAHNLTILNTHLAQEAGLLGLPQPLFMHNLTPNHFTAAIADSALSFIQKLNNYQSAIYNQTLQEKQMYLAIKTATPTSSRLWLERKNLYYNTAVAEMVKNTNQTERMEEAETQFYQKLYPIYRPNTPDTPNWSVRSHFFASEKSWLGYQISTLWFNILVIWLMCLVAYAALYYDLLRKGVASLTKILD